MKKIIVTLLAVFCFGCASVGQGSEELAPPVKKIQADSWQIEFSYDNVTTEVKTLPDGSEEISIKDFGQSDASLQILDNIFLDLTNKELNISKDNDSAEGRISIHPVFFYGTSSISASINVYIYLNNELYTHSQITTYSNVSYQGTKRISNKIIDYILSVITI